MSAPQANPSLAQYMDANGWIDRKVRPPTKADEDKHKEVLWFHPEHGMAVAGHNTAWVDEGWDYWKPAGPGPVVETEEERMKREDEEARQSAWLARHSDPRTELAELSNFNAGWHAALAHARKASK